MIHPSTEASSLAPQNLNSTIFLDPSKELPALVAKNHSLSICSPLPSFSSFLPPSFIIPSSPFFLPICSFFPSLPRSFSPLLPSLPFFLHFTPPIFHPSSFSPIIHQLIQPSFFLCIYPFLFPSIHSFIHSSFHLFVLSSINLIFIHPSIRLLLIHSLILPSIYLSSQSAIHHPHYIKDIVGFEYAVINEIKFALQNSPLTR